MGKKINIRPTTGVYATYKNIKYDPWTAIAEFVDNSTQSYYDNASKLKNTKYWQGLNVEIIYEKSAIEGDKIIIRDNAYGMNFHDFQRAIVLDSPPKKFSRSEFGMGLKTAACWFGKKWSVESTELGSNIKYYAAVDVDALHKYKAEEIEVQEIDCSPKEHGTTITIWDLNRTVKGRQVGKTKDQLRGMYRTDLRTGDITISYNGENLYYEEPKILTEDLPDGTKKVWKKEISFTIPFKEEELNVQGFIALRETASTSAAGFALLRRGRVIIGGYENAYRPEEVFEKSNSFVYQRLFGELNMDNWPVTQTKDAFDWYSGLEDLLIEKLNEVCYEYKKKAKVYRVGKKVSLEDTTTTLLDTFSNAGVITNAEIKNIIVNTESEEQQQPEAEQQLPQEEQDKEVVEPVTIVENTISKKENDIVIEGASCKKISFEMDGQEYIFNLFLLTDDPQKNWLNISRMPNGEYQIDWNIRHAFFKPYINEPEFLAIMEQFVFAMALTEIEVMQLSEDSMVEASAVRMKMNDILKELVQGGNK